MEIWNPNVAGSYGASSIRARGKLSEVVEVDGAGPSAVYALKDGHAARLAHTIAGDVDAMRIVQFHASYSMKTSCWGFAPKQGGGFHLQKTVAPICDDAAERPAVQHVLRLFFRMFIYSEPS